MSYPSVDQVTGFSRLRVRDWRQFEDVEVIFHPKLTVLTGANASGKTTLLGLLGRHLNWQQTYLRSRGSDNDGTRFLPRRKRRRLERLTPDGEVPAGWDEVGALDYSNGTRSAIAIPSPNSLTPDFSQYDVAIFSQQNVAGLYLPSHRQLSTYQQVTEISLHALSAQSLLNSYTQELRLRQITPGQYLVNKTPMAILKQGLITSALFGEGNSSVRGDAEAQRIWTGFQDVLRILVPDNIEFERLAVRRSEVIIESGTGDYPIDEVSGGLSAIIELSWQIFLTSLVSDKFTVVLDEPENHLHPNLQKKMLVDFIEAFPRAQFVVATHSPFVVTSVEDSHVYVLEHQIDSGRVSSRMLDQINKAGDADSVLREVLGVGSTLPLWAESQFERIIRRFSAETPTEDSLRKLRNDLEESGLENSFPEALTALRRLLSRENL